jgi:hypothetical protein
MADQELTPSEKRALSELPRERAPGELLEDRVVRSLRDHGLLRKDRGRAPVLPTFRVAAAIAASLLLVAIGFVAGRWTSPSAPHDPPTTGRQAHDLAVAAALQQAASAYVGALEDLEHSLQTAGSDEVRQGREVALASLYSAANRVGRVVPAERLADRFRDAINASFVEAQPRPGHAERLRIEF